MKRSTAVLGLVGIAWMLTSAGDIFAATNDHFASRRQEVERRKQQQVQIVIRPWGGPTTHSNWWTPHRPSPPVPCWCGRGHCGHRGHHPHGRTNTYQYNNFYYPYGGMYLRPGIFIPH